MNPPAASTRLKLNLEQLPTGKRRIRLDAEDGALVAPRIWDTSYPEPLINAIYAAKGSYLCDEIMREEDPRYVENSVRKEVLAYVDAAQFAGKRVLDFGCGSGASTMVLKRLLPPCEIVGVELEERLLRLAQMRAEHFGGGRVRFLRSPTPDTLPEGLGQFDYVLFSAVFEHLLPNERSPVLSLIWSHIKPGGVLFLNQTPHRFSPFEMHTTFLPLINYLPDRLALRMARFSRHVARGATWEELLREGIRGGTVNEVLGILRKVGDPVLLEPLQGDRIDLWHSRLSARRAGLKRAIWRSLKMLKKVSGIELQPELGLAIRKQA
jgi:2-polyprenyl-3-methyl-5-hydroxy-6-metoxy-1,4-benzoquinol methylase